MTWAENPYRTGGTAGLEVSSGPAGGRYITVLESTLTHPTHADGLVDKGDPCYVGVISGVCLQDAAAATDYVVIDTAGIYELSVTSASGAIAVGDQLYIDSSGVLNETSSGDKKFGAALGAVGATATAIIAVKLGQLAE